MRPLTPSPGCSHRILLIRLSAIGDVVVTTPVSRSIRTAMPGAYVCWVVEPKARDMVLGNPYLDDVIVWDRLRDRSAGRQRESYSWLRQELRQRRFDVAVDFQGLLRSGFVAWISGARWRIGNSGCKEPVEWLYTHRVSRPANTTSSRQRCLDLLRPLGIETTDRSMVIPIAEADRREAGLKLASLGVAGQPYACLAPSTTWKHKHWIDERWARLADDLRDTLGLLPVFLGGPGDRSRAAAILAQMQGPGADLTGQTPLKEAAAIIEGARLMIAVDTGLLHIAAGLRTPLVGLCGASYWPGFRDYEEFTLVREPFPCSPCLHHPICTYVDCMQAILPSTVLSACRQRLGSAGPVSP